MLLPQQPTTRPHCAQTTRILTRFQTLLSTIQTYIIYIHTNTLLDTEAQHIGRTVLLSNELKPLEHIQRMSMEVLEAVAKIDQLHNVQLDRNRSAVNHGRDVTLYLRVLEYLIPVNIWAYRACQAAPLDPRYVWRGIHISPCRWKIASNVSPRNLFI